MCQPPIPLHQSTLIHTPSAVCHCEPEEVLREPLGAQLGVALHTLTSLVYMDNAVSCLVAFSPFKSVQEAPGKVCRQVDIILQD